MDNEKILLHANEYIKKMAKGINPLTGEFVSTDDLNNNVKISRCLFYVSEVLEDYYEMICNKNCRREKKYNFYAQRSDFLHFNYSEEPIYISLLTSKINDMFHKEDMKKLSAIAVTDWLVSKGYLSLSVKDNGHTTKIPTSLGENLGITSIIKEGKKGPYLVNVYNVSAQRFIIDNIEEISLSIQK